VGLRIIILAEHQITNIINRLLCSHRSFSALYCPGRLSPDPVASIFLRSLFSPARDHCFVGNPDIKRRAPYFLVSLKNLIVVLSSTLKTIFLKQCNSNVNNL